MPDPSDFTERERFLIGYYCHEAPRQKSKLLSVNFQIILFSLACLAAAIWKEDPTIALVAYILVLGRLIQVVGGGSGVNDDLRNILTKYQAKLKKAAEGSPGSTEE